MLSRPGLTKSSNQPYIGVHCGATSESSLQKSAPHVAPTTSFHQWERRHIPCGVHRSKLGTGLNELQFCNPKKLQKTGSKIVIFLGGPHSRAHRHVLTSCQPRTPRDRLSPWRPVENFPVPHPAWPRAVRCQFYRERACLIFWTRTIVRMYCS